MVRSKHTKRAFVVLCLVAILLTLNGCKKKTQANDDIEETADVAGEPMLIELDSSIGAIRFGMSKDEIIGLLGQPEGITGEGTGLNYISSQGLAFTVSAELGVQVIKCWSENWPAKLPFDVTTFAGTTKEGVGMGDTREKIIDAYGQPDKVNSKGVFENLHYNKLGAKFTLVQDEIVAMNLKAPE